jgi:hypothetical protein
MDWKASSWICWPVNVGSRSILVKIRIPGWRDEETQLDIRRCRLGSALRTHYIGASTA